MWSRLRKALDNPPQAACAVARRFAKLWGYRGYRRFVILTRSRTGSNMLMSMLNSQPGVRAYGEKFARLNGQPYARLLAKIFDRQPRSLKAVGFKLFYYHPRDAQAPGLWRDLIAMDGLHVLHLKRRNILRTLVSRKIAEQQDRWRIADPVQRGGLAERQVTFTIEELREGFEKTRAWQQEYPAKFAGHPVLEICYEDLVSAPETEFRRILDFLGLPYYPPQTPLKKQNPEKLSELVINYALLKAAFADTEWAAFFED